MKKRIGLVGAGIMGSHHARVISSSKSAKLEFIVDPREEFGRKTADKYGTIWLPEMPSLSDIDGVVIAAATEAHFPLASQVLEEDTALLVEKPIAASLEETEALLALSQSRSVPMTCGFLERFNPAVITALLLVETPLHVKTTRHSPYTPRIKTGVTWDLLVHDIDIALRIFNEDPTSVSGILGSFHQETLLDAEDVVEASLRFSSGQIAQLSASRVGQRKIRQLSIYEMNRLIEVDLLRRDVTIFSHVSEDMSGAGSRAYRQQTVIEIPEIVSSSEPLVSQFENFLNLIDGKVSSDIERNSLYAPHKVVEQIRQLSSR